MEQQRIILHSDANAFYASVECALQPELKGKAVAVCGSTELRHGIVLAKSELAKKAGVKTGMANWEAKRLCPNLIIVPPRHEIYAEYSKRLHEIYLSYTDLVEPYGLDECWLDVTHNLKNHFQIADEIRERVKRELDITVSIGISFNKVFAKLGSDMKKPDAVTHISQENYKQTVWRLPCSDLLYCGRATTEKLHRLGIKTIGGLANFSREYLAEQFGKNGETLWLYANGLDDSPVCRYGEGEQAKSVGHGITCVSDLHTLEEVSAVLISLSQEIGQKLRQLHLQARGIQVTVRDNQLKFHSWQQQLEQPTQCAATLSKAGAKLLAERYLWKQAIRALTISAINLESVDSPNQISLFEGESDARQRKIEGALDGLREKFGDGCVKPAVLFLDHKIPERKGTMAKFPKRPK